MVAFGFPDIAELANPQTSSELLADQRMQAAAITERVQSQEVRDAQMLPQGYSTPEGTSFEFLSGFKQGGAIPDAGKRPSLTPFLVVIGVAWVLGLASRRRR